MIDSSSPLRSAILEGLDHLQRNLSRLPKPVSKNLQDDIQTLRALLLEQRPARVMLIGRRGSGKSSLVNAILGENVAAVGHERAQTGKGRWWPYSSDAGNLDILDTRGLHEGSDPEEDDDADSPFASILREVHQTSPDLILFTVKASDVDSGIHADLNQLAAVVAHIQKRTTTPPSIIGVLTHCDIVEPKHIALHRNRPEDPDDALDYDEKHERIQRLEDLLLDHFCGHPTLKNAPIVTRGVCTYQSFRSNGSRRADERWQIETLLSLVLDRLPTEARLEFARLSQIRSLQRTIAEQTTTLVAALCAGVASVPLPVADLVPIASLQATLISSIAYIAGRKVDAQNIREFLAAVGLTVGAGVILREVARTLSKALSPGPGTLVSAGIAYAATVGIGRAAVAHYLQDEPQEQLKTIFTRAQKEAQDTFSETQNPAQLPEGSP